MMSEFIVSNQNIKTIEIPPFDVLAEQSDPFEGFGQILTNLAALESRFQNEIASAQHRLQDGFNMRFTHPSEIPDELDRIVSCMWDDGWDPKRGNINLFIRDFGCILAKAVLDSLGGRPVFRSAEDLSHLSIFWDNAKLEAFPFHKVIKCLYNRQGESMTSFVNGIASKLTRQP